MSRISEEIEVRIFKHKCRMCSHVWQSAEKADLCRRCDHWHISFSSFLVFKKARIIKQNRRQKQWQVN